MRFNINITGAEQKPLSVAELRQLYDKLLSGKILVPETKDGNTVIRKERRFYPINLSLLNVLKRG